jgi:hypothetical protein
MWFSSVLKLAHLVEGRGLVSEERSVMVFRADDEDGALLRIIELARAREERHVNGAGEKVRWTVSQIVTLDLIAEGGDLGDREVFSEIVPLTQPDPTVPFTIAYPLQHAKPYQTGV